MGALPAPPRVRSACEQNESVLAMIETSELVSCNGKQTPGPDGRPMGLESARMD
jgi:hypothetical protein